MIPLKAHRSGDYLDDIKGHPKDYVLFWEEEEFYSFMGKDSPFFLTDPKIFNAMIGKEPSRGISDTARGIAGSYLNSKEMKKIEQCISEREKNNEISPELAEKAREFITSKSLYLLNAGEIYTNIDAFNELIKVDPTDEEANSKAIQKLNHLECVSDILALWSTWILPPSKIPPEIKDKYSELALDMCALPIDTVLETKYIQNPDTGKNTPYIGFKLYNYIINIGFKSARFEVNDTLSNGKSWCEGLYGDYAEQVEKYKDYEKFGNRNSSDEFAAQ